MTRRPIFLERRTYRRTRARDASKLLPVIGAFLFLMPLIWSVAPARPLSTALGGLYIFGVWAVLILAAWAFARSFGKAEPPEDGSGPER